MGISIRALVKSYGGNTVLGGIDLDVGDCEVAAVLGPSGCGKTTLLRIISRLEKEDSGSIDRGACGGFSFVFQEPRLFPRASARDNLRIALRGAMGDEEADSRAERFLALIGLKDSAEKKPSVLSGGMRQRLSLARGFAFPADILLMDEPFQSLDIGLRASLLDTFNELWKAEPRTVVFVTHDPDEALYIGDSLMVMGGSPARVVDRFRVPGMRGERRLMSGELLAAESRLYESLIGKEGSWKSTRG